MNMGFFIPQFNEHLYTLAATGLKKVDYVFGTRQAAVKKMYEIIAQKHLAIKEIYDDHHFKTYVCEDGIKFYINRV